MNKQLQHLLKLILPTLFLVCLLAVGSAQTTIVKGVVKDVTNNDVLEGVSVTIKGTRQGTRSDAKGNYTINTNINSTLVFTLVGYKPVEETLKGRQTINLQLSPVSTSLQNVVVTALGIKREEKALGYATTTVTGEQLTNAVSTNWTDALSGKVAGLNLIRSNGGPTGSNKIILRGENNLTGNNEALIVLDGVVINQGSGRRTSIAGETAYGTGSDNMPVDYGSSINDINPQDIESVTVLKGPGAAALYGERGANGAIIITTKSGGNKKKGLGISFTSNVNIEQINRWPKMQYDYGQGLDGTPYYSFGTSADGASTSATSSAYGPRFNGQMFYQYDPLTQTQGKERTPWLGYQNKSRDYFETGTTISNSISVSGGTDKTSARFSVSNVHNTWITPNTGFDRTSIGLSVNTKVSDKLQISSKLNYTNKSSDNLPGNGYGNQSIMYWYIFWQPNADVNWLKNYWVNGQEGRKIFYPFSSFPENPYAIAYEFINKENRNDLTGNIQATYNFTKELSLQVRTSIDNTYDQRAQERPYDAGSRLPRGSYRTQDVFSQELSGDFLLRYAKKINKDIDFSVTGGGSALRNSYNKNEIRADSLFYPGLYTVANSAGPLLAIPYKSKYAINSFYGLATLGYKKFLYVDGTIRKDWNSTLATPFRTSNSGFLYPSGSFSFVASEVLKMPAVVDFAKLRFSLSGVGSGSTVPYRTSYNYDPANNGIFNGGLQLPAVLANPDLKPLKTTTFETGTNIRMFKNRLNIDVAVYSGNTKNQILSRVVDRASGYNTEIINAGRINNKGIEVSVNGTVLKTPGGFKWNSSVVFSANKNQIIELPDTSIVLRTGPVGGGQIVAKVGGSMGALYGRGYQRAADGQVIYDATTGFAKLTQDVIYLGNTMPRGKVGFTNEFIYRAFRLNVLFDAQYGAVGHSLTHYKLAEQGKLIKTLPGRYNGIIGNGVVDDGTGKYITNTTVATDVDEYYRSHFGVDNAEGSTFRTDFIKFREASLDYTLNSRVTKRLGLQKATLGVYGRNLFIWSDWPAFDPEFGTLSGTDIVQGFEIGQFPSTRSMGVNLVVTF